MLTNVRTKSLLPAEKTVRVVFSPGTGAPAVHTELSAAAGVLSVAAQVRLVLCRARTTAAGRCVARD